MEIDERALDAAFDWWLDLPEEYGMMPMVRGIIEKYLEHANKHSETDYNKVREETAKVLSDVAAMPDPFFKPSQNPYCKHGWYAGNGEQCPSCYEASGIGLQTKASDAPRHYPACYDCGFEHPYHKDTCVRKLY